MRIVAPKPKRVVRQVMMAVRSVSHCDLNSKIFGGEVSFTRFLTDLEAFFAFGPSLSDEQRLRFCLTSVAID